MKHFFVTLFSKYIFWYDKMLCMLKAMIVGLFLYPRTLHLPWFYFFGISCVQIKLTWQRWWIIVFKNAFYLFLCYNLRHTVNFPKDSEHRRDSRFCTKSFSLPLYVAWLNRSTLRFPLVSCIGYCGEHGHSGKSCPYSLIQEIHVVSPLVDWIPVLFRVFYKILSFSPR